MRRHVGPHDSARRRATAPVPAVEDPALIEAARRFFPDLVRIEPVGARRHLARVETPSGAWCVRRWPDGTPRERVTFVHRLLATSRSGGCEIVPLPVLLPDSGTAELLLDGAWFDAQSWMPGRPPTRGREIFDATGRLIHWPEPLPSGTLPAVAEALAGWHRATEKLARERTVPVARLDAIVRAVRVSWGGQRQRLRPHAATTPHIQRWLRTSEQVMRVGTAALASASYLRGGHRVIAHLNLWPAHLLFATDGERSRLTGLLDFAEAAVSSPLVDLGQLLTHFGGWTVAAAEEAIGAYASVIPLTPEERRLLPVVAGIDAIVETGRLLVLAYASGMRPESAEADTLRHGAVAMLVSLENLAPAVLRGDRPVRPRGRRWERRAPQAARDTKPARAPRNVRGPSGQPRRGSTGRSTHHDAASQGGDQREGGTTQADT